MSLPGCLYINSCFFLSRLVSKSVNNLLWIGLRAVFALILFFSIIAVNAQTITGSVYSYFGIGNLQGRSSAYNRALGYTGVAVRDNYNINGINPASYNSIGKPFTTLFEIGGNYESTFHETGVSSSTSKTGGLNGINFLVKPSTKLGLMVGATPLSNISYSASSPIQFPSISTPTQIISEGSGGINQFYFGASYPVFKNFSVGGNFSYYLGTIKKIVTVPPTIVTPQLIVANRTTAHNSGFDLGAQYTINVKETGITLGATWDRGTFLSGTQQTSVVNLNLDTIKKTDKLATRYRLPPSYGAGLAVKTKRSTFAADIHFIDWKKAVMNDASNVTYQNSLKYSVGYEYRGDPYAMKYISLISLRGGFFIQDYPVVTAMSFKTWGYTVGISLPLENYRASVNINYSFTQLGTTQAGLVREQSGKLVLDFIVRDIWGIKRKFD